MIQTRVVCACLLGLLAFSAYAANCDAIQDLKLPDTTITLAERVTSGDLDVAGLATPLHELPVLCRVTGILQPTSDSEIHFEVCTWRRAWNTARAAPVQLPSAS